MKLQAFVPLVTYPDPNSPATAANAAAFAAHIDAKLHAVALNADIPAVSNVLARLLMNLPEMIREAEELSRRQGRHLLDAVREKALVMDVAVATQEVGAPLAFFGEAAAGHARYHDLSLVGWSSANPTSRMVAEAVIFGSGRPAVLMPETSPQAIKLDRVAIAWDGSRVAARAAADSFPFLQLASTIHVLTVGDEKPLTEANAGARMAGSLRERGFPAEAVAVTGHGRPIAETLQRQAVDMECGLLVMGGYGHSRVRDFVLGGATEGVLSDLTMPVLLSH